MQCVLIWCETIPCDYISLCQLLVSFPDSLRITILTLCLYIELVSGLSSEVMYLHCTLLQLDRHIITLDIKQALHAFLDNT